MSTTIVIAALGAFILALAAFAAVRTLRQRHEENTFLEDAGFTLCPEDRDDIEILVRDMENCADSNSFRVIRPACTYLHGRPVYFYTKARHFSTDAAPAEFQEFLFEFNRKSDLPVILYMPPVAIPESILKRVIGPMIGLCDAYKRENLVKLDLPRELQASKLIAAYGPPGAGLYDLLTPPEISLILSGVERGAFIFTANKDIAAVDTFSGYIDIDMHDLWSFVRTLAEN